MVHEFSRWESEKQTEILQPTQDYKKKEMAKKFTMADATTNG
jgi:hypothetical protein